MKHVAALLLLLVPLSAYGQGTIEMPATVAGKVGEQVVVEIKTTCKDATWDVIPTNDADGKPLEYDVSKDPSAFILRITPKGAGTYYLVVAGALDNKVSEKKCIIIVAGAKPQPIPVPPLPPVPALPEVTKADLQKLQAQLDAIRAAMPRQPTKAEADALTAKLEAARRYMDGFSDHGFILVVDALDMLAAFAENAAVPIPPTPVPPSPPIPVPPAPTPTPVATDKLYLLAFYDKASVPVPAMIGDLEYWQALKTSGHNWRKIDVKNADAVLWQKYYGKVTPPSLVILDATANKYLATVPLPPDRAAFDAVVKKYTGK